MRDFRNFDRFLSSLTHQVYPEIPSDMARNFTRSGIEWLRRDGHLTDAMRVLDVGCGQGVALEIFRDLGISAVGITLGTDYQVCRDKGFDVHEMDQNFMSFADHSFDVLWCRHVLEHSVAPLFTLSEYARVVKPGGLVYVEVPAPDTAAHHERNPNHYSLLPVSMWASLFERAGFTLLSGTEVNFTVPMGPDSYWAFLLKSAAAAA